jgi:hypothetical protein
LEEALRQALNPRPAGVILDLRGNPGGLLDASVRIGSYFVPNARVTAHCCRTNLPPFTAFRGFGAPQAMLVMEAAIARSAEKLGVVPADVPAPQPARRRRQLPFGMKVERSRARRPSPRPRSVSALPSSLDRSSSATASTAAQAAWR